MQLGSTDNQPGRAFVEEKFFDLRLGESGSLLKEALEEAIGAELTELAPGMWTGKYPTDRSTWIEVTARAQAVEDGTSVQICMEHRATWQALTLAWTLFIVGACLLLPLIPILVWLQKTLRKQQRERLVLMHKIWTELGAVIGAPRRATYREKPQRVYVPPSRIQAEQQASAAAGLEAAEAEAAEAEAAEAEAAEAERA